MRKLPAFLKKYFWDVEFEKLDMDRSRLFVLGRLIEYGDEKAASFLTSNFTRDEVAKLLSFARLDPKSANYWALILDIDRRNVQCLQRHYLEIRRRHWPY